MTYIEKRRRLVEQQHARLLRQCARHQHALLLSARKAAIVPFPHPLAIHRPQRHFHLRPILGPFKPAVHMRRAAHHHHLLHPVAKRQLEHWLHHGHLLRHAAAPNRSNALLAEPRLTISRFLQARQHPQQRTLARAIGPHHNHQFTSPQLEVHLFEQCSPAPPHAHPFQAVYRVHRPAPLIITRNRSAASTKRGPGTTKMSSFNGNTRFSRTARNPVIRPHTPSTSSR